MSLDRVAIVGVWTGEKLQMDRTSNGALVTGLKRLRLGVGEEVAITFEKLVAARSNAANREYWGYTVRPIALASEGQMSMNEVHRLLKAELLPSERFTLVNPETGTVVLERDLEQQTTVRLTDEEFRNYMEQSRALGATQMGIDFSDRGLWDRFGIGNR